MFLDFFKGFNEGATEVGQGVGGFLTGTLSPVFGGAKSLLGTTTTTQTSGRQDDGGTRTVTIVVAVISVVAVAAVLIVLFKS